ncbi:MAG: AMP-binding protein [Chitinispirillales bacterium]|jgi:phenylacetate-coenzyme A ligase PaaK-like adenylate-forming protein|nr:AMP-binding protein [Chitinispirillales bacterium]
MKTITPEESRRLISEGGSQTHEQRMNVAQDRLRELVTFAKERSPYFKKAYGGIKENYRLADLPITTKSGLMENYEEWVTDPEIKLSELRNYLSDIKNIAELYLNRYTAITTSGTTGEPMPMVRDSYRNTIHGSLIETRLFRGLNPKDINPAVVKTASVITASGFVSSYSSALRMKHRLGEFSDNFEIFSLLTPIDELVERLNAHDPKLLTGYPSVLTVLAKEKLRGALKIEPRVIASSAEALSVKMFENLRQAFNCPVLNNYCSTEGGEIAMSCPYGHLHINEDWVLIEPVDDDGRPVKQGEWSSAVLMTDLTNYVQPIIRYHVNDCVRIIEQPCECGSNLPIIEISGRMGDALCFNEKIVAFLVLYCFLTEVCALLKWQLIQTAANTLEVRFTEADGADRTSVGAEVAEALKTSLKKYGCGDVDIVISDEDFIKAKGGKVPYVIQGSRT